MATPHPRQPALDEDAGPLQSPWQVMRVLAPVIPVIILNGLGLGMIGPMSNFVGLNFFSQRYTTLTHKEIHCEKLVTTPYCQAALQDNVWITEVLSIVAPIVQFVVVPLAGVMSDRWGRRRVMILFHILGLVSFFSALSFVLFGTSLYWHYALISLSSNPITGTSVAIIIFIAVTVDLIPNSQNRVTGLAVQQALGIASSMVGSVVGYNVTLETAFVMGFTVQVVLLLYFIFYFPETLSQEDRKSEISLSSMMPGMELRILWRTSLLLRLTAFIILVCFIDTGFSRISPLLLQRKMNWAAQQSYLNAFVANLGTILALGLMLQPLVRCFGVVGVLLIGRAVGWAGAIFFVWFTQPQQVYVSSFVINGFLACTLPLVQGMTSALARRSEQGTMTGALNTVAAVTDSLGVLVFNMIFGVTNRSTYSINYTPFYLHTALGIPALLLICSFRYSFRNMLPAGDGALEEGAGSTLLQKAGPPAQEYGAPTDRCQLQRPEPCRDGS